MTIAFKKVKDAYGWMGNMSPHPVLGFKTAEAAFQAMRFDPMSPVFSEIKAAKSPMGAKMIAKKAHEHMLVVPRSITDLENMLFVLRMKFMVGHSDLADQLLATGDEEIVEDVTSRPNESGLFWGAKLNKDGTWEGQNHLGKMLMKVRAELKALRAIAESAESTEDGSNEVRGAEGVSCGRDYLDQGE